MHQIDQTDQTETIDASDPSGPSDDLQEALQIRLAVLCLMIAISEETFTCKSAVNVAAIAAC